jgi:ectoine hydroxylase-related dioxygenase (phytanoyl-CoA dioxygenase family)
MAATATMNTDSSRLDIDSPYVLTDSQVKSYRENGYIKLKHVLSPEVLSYYGEEISQQVGELNTQHLPIEQRGTYGKAFLQVTNIWTKSAIVKEFIMGKRLARIAAELMGVSGVRIYHDQALFKEPGGGITPWHADQYYWPLSNKNTVTAWIPLLAVPQEMGPLAFARGTHRTNFGRDLEISDESEVKLSEFLKNSSVEETPFELGEISFHCGWIFHRAAANRSSKVREVMTIIYMDEDTRLIEPRNKNQRNDWDWWCPGAEIGAIINSPLNPVVWTSHEPSL